MKMSLSVGSTQCKVKICIADRYNYVHKNLSGKLSQSLEQWNVPYWYMLTSLHTCFLTYLACLLIHLGRSWAGWASSLEGITCENLHISRKLFGFNRIYRINHNVHLKSVQTKWDVNLGVTSHHLKNSHVLFWSVMSCNALRVLKI